MPGGGSGSSPFARAMTALPSSTMGAVSTSDAPRVKIRAGSASLPVLPFVLGRNYLRDLLRESDLIAQLLQARDGAADEAIVDRGLMVEAEVVECRSFSDHVVESRQH